MARQVTAQVKLQVSGGQATPAPPVGPALGQHGVNIGAFVSQFNDRTKEMRGVTVPVVITVYSDRSFEFIVKSPPAAAASRSKGESFPENSQPWRRNKRTPRTPPPRSAQPRPRVAPPRPARPRSPGPRRRRRPRPSPNPPPCRPRPSRRPGPPPPRR